MRRQEAAPVPGDVWIHDPGNARNRLTPAAAEASAPGPLEIVSKATGTRRPSKKRIISEYRQAHRLERAGLAEIQAIQAELRSQLGDSGRTSVSYITHVLRQSGTEVDVPVADGGPWSDKTLPERYAAQLGGVLQFGDLVTAEKSIRDLHAAYREYRARGDTAGMRLVRAIALKGRIRAGMLGASRRVSSGKRQEKQEIATWFRVWLQSPGLFEEWLELRKNSDEFKRTFPMSAEKQSVS